MMCDKCGVRAASSHITRTVNGVTREYNLCPVCAAQMGFAAFNPFDISNLFGSLLESEKQVAPTKRCGKCGSSFDEIVNSGRMGCPECYEFFKEEIAPSIIKIHGKVNHVGDSPSYSKCEDQKEVSELEQLKNELAKAIESEEFEKAATLRDEIRDIEKEK